MMNSQEKSPSGMNRPTNIKIIYAIFPVDGNSPKLDDSPGTRNICVFFADVAPKIPEISACPLKSDHKKIPH